MERCNGKQACSEKQASETWRKLLSLSPDDARDNWYKELLTCEGEKAARKFLEDYEWVLAKNPDTVVSTLGQTPYGIAIFLYAALSNLTKQGATPRVYLITSEDTERHADDIIIHLSTCLGLDSGIFHILKVDHRSVEDVYQKIREAGLFTQGVSLVDITGGTKAMSSALLGAAYTIPMLRGGAAAYIFYSYVPQERQAGKRGYPAKPYTTEIRLQGTPLEIYRDYVLQEALTKARAFAFDSAKQLLESLKSYALKTDTRSYAEAIQNIVDFLEKLAYFELNTRGLEALMKISRDEFTYLREKLGIDLRLQALERLIKRLRSIGRLFRNNVNPLNECRGDRNECARDMLLFAYLLYLIGLAWEKKFPALSTQIYYRAVEMALQSYLLSRGIWAGGKTPLEELKSLGLPESLYKEFASRARDEEGVTVVRLALRDDAEIVNALVGGLPDFDRLNNYTQARNTSILAHGLYRPTPRDASLKMLRRYVPCMLGYIAKLLGTDFDTLRGEAQPVEAILGVEGEPCRQG